MKDQARTPRSFVVLLCIMGTAALILFWYSLQKIPPVWSSAFVLVLVVAALSEFFSFELPNFTVVLSYPLAMSAVVLGGPAASGLVAAASAITVSDIRRHRPPAILAFNLFSLVTVSCLAGWTYVVLGGRILTAGMGTLESLGPADFPGALVGMIGCAIVSAVSNLVIISFGISLYQRQSFRKILVSGIPIIPTQLALPFVGFLMAQVLSIAVIALPLFIFPLVVARQFYQRSTKLRDAYADTVRSLVGALEAKDPYTRGHSERVANYAIELGTASGLDDGALQRLEYAALLHDLGKLEVPGAVLTKPGQLDSAEREAIRRHPTRGADMVAKIPPLRDLAGLVGRHHEWFDGGGYPDAKAGLEIPLAALILGVADSYDAMTTTRSYRPAMDRESAVAELVKGAGTQFDPELVRSFIEHHVGAELRNESAADHRAEPNMMAAEAVST